MSQTTTDIKDELKKGLDHLQTLRDEVKVRLHLAGMEAKAEWNKLEPHLFEVEQAAKEVNESSHRAVTEAIAKLKKLRESFTT
jgi:hypothetical protein